jgi:hypothetical protein
VQNSGGTANGGEDTDPSPKTMTINVIAGESTSTTLSVSPSAPTYGQAVTLVATVAPAPPGSGTPTGSVTFADSNTSLGTANLGAGGTATLVVSTLKPPAIP